MSALSRRAASFIAGLSITLAVSTAAAPEPGRAARDPGSADESAVKGVVGDFVEALNTADIEKFSALLAPDVTAFFPLAPILELLDGKQNVVKVFTIFFESVRKEGGGPRYMDLKPEGLKIQLYGGTAVVTFHFTGKTMFSRRTLVFHREAGKWLIVHMHGSGLPLQEQ
jgi:ketosteroid isomerase-like protein